MGDKDKTTARKKTYEKPTADRIPDNALTGVTGGGADAPGQGIQCRVPGAIVLNTCRPSGLAALHKCQAGGAALGCLPAGGAVASGCHVGGTDSDN